MLQLAHPLAPPLAPRALDRYNHPPTESCSSRLPDEARFDGRRTANKTNYTLSVTQVCRAARTPHLISCFG